MVNSIPYFLLFIFLLFSSIPVTNTISSKQHLVYYQMFFVFIVMVYFFCFRAYIETDWINYKIWFDDLPTIWDSGETFVSSYQNDFYKKNILFFALGLFVKSIVPSYFFFQLVCSFIDIVFYFFCFSKISKEKTILIFLFFFLFEGISLEFNLLRNIKSLIIFIYSLKFIQNKNFKKYLICNLIGSLFHTSAFLFIPLYFVLGRKINRLFLLFLYFFGIIIYVLQIPWVSKVITPIVRGITGNSALTKLVIGYLTKKGKVGITIGFLEKCFSFMLCFLFYNKLIKKNELNNIYCNCLFLYVLLNLFFSELFLFTQRASFLFVFGYWFVYPQIYEVLRKQYKILFLIIILFYGSLKTLLAYRSPIMKYETFIGNYMSADAREEIVWDVIESDSKKFK